jgi:hypothetical protein
MWPVTPDTGWRGRFSDYALAGREVLVQYAGPALTSKLSRKAKEHSGAFVTVCDWESMQPERDGFRCVANVEVVELVERSIHSRVDDETERALGREGDVVDPFAR